MAKESLINWSLYQCYEDGRIYSKNYNKKKFLKGVVNKDGYVQVGLKCIDKNYRIFMWHRVIWTAFNGEISEELQVNHIDENKQNNTLSNLNLMTPKENSNWGTHNKRNAAKQINNPLKSKQVVAVKDGVVVFEFASTREAGRNGFTQQNVSDCCRLKLKQHKGYQWYFKSEWLEMKNASPHKREDAYQLEINFN